MTEYFTKLIDSECYVLSFWRSAAFDMKTVHYLEVSSPVRGRCSRRLAAVLCFSSTSASLLAWKATSGTSGASPPSPHSTASSVWASCPLTVQPINSK